MFRSWGYTYSVFFDGNAFHWDATPPSLSIDDGDCPAFSTTIDGVVTELDSTSYTYSVTVDNVADGGFILSESATADEVTAGLSVLPSVSSPMLTYRGVADEQQANSWTMSFSSNGGAVPQLVCVTEDSFVGSCDVSAPYAAPGSPAFCHLGSHSCISSLVLPLLVGQKREKNI